MRRRCVPILGCTFTPTKGRKIGGTRVVNADSKLTMPSFVAVMMLPPVNALIAVRKFWAAVMVPVMNVADQRLLTDASAFTCEAGMYDLGLPPRQYAVVFQDSTTESSASELTPEPPAPVIACCELMTFVFVPSTKNVDATLVVW